MTTILETFENQLQLGTNLLTDITRQALQQFKSNDSYIFQFRINAPCEFEDWFLIVVQDYENNISYELYENNEQFEITVYEAIDLCITHLIHSNTVI